MFQPTQPTKIPCEGKILEISIKQSDKEVWAAHYISTRQNIPNRDVYLKGYINILDKSKQKKFFWGLFGTSDYMNELTRYFEIILDTDGARKDINKVIDYQNRNRRMSTQLTNQEEMKKSESGQLNWSEIDKVARKRILVSNSVMHIYNEDQFPGQDEPLTYVLQEFTRKISMVIQP